MLTNESRVCFNNISVMRWHQILPRFSSRQNPEFRNDYGFLCILLNPHQSICHAWKPTDHQVEARYDLICLWVNFNSSLCIFILNIYHLSLPTGSHLNVSYTNFGKRKKKTWIVTARGPARHSQVLHSSWLAWCEMIGTHPRLFLLSNWGMTGGFI